MRNELKEPQCAPSPPLSTPKSNRPITGRTSNIYVVCCDDAKNVREPPFQSPCTDLITSMMSPFFSKKQTRLKTFKVSLEILL